MTAICRRPTCEILGAFLFFLCACRNPRTLGQDLLELGVLSRKEEPVVCVSPYGVEIRRRSVLQVDDSTDRLRLIEVPEVKAELDLTAEQLSELRSLEEQNREFVAKQFDELISSQTNVVGYSRRFHQQQAELDAQISTILRPKQVERLNELFDRMLVRRFGLGFFLEAKESNKEVAVSSDDRKSISTKAQELLKEVQETKAELLAKCLECVLDELDEHQLKVLGIEDTEEFIRRSTESAGDAALDLFIVQAKDSKWSASEKPELPSGFPTVQTTVFVAADDGNLSRFVSGFHSRVCDGERVAGYAQMLGLILSEKNREMLGLSNAQITELKKAEDYLIEKLVEIDLFIFQAENPWNANENAIDMQLALGKELDRRFGEILSAGQSSTLQALSQKSNAIGSGWLAELQDQLRTHNRPLSAKQLGQLKAKLKATCAETAEQIGKLNLATARTLSAQIHDENLRYYLDKRLKGDDNPAGGNLVFLIADLRNLAHRAK